MIIPDINLLVYAYNSDAPDHRKARAWWENALSASQPVALPWVVHEHESGKNSGV
jgi:predicted nucleic acid-binding protein